MFGLGREREGEDHLYAPSGVRLSLGGLHPMELNPLSERRGVEVAPPEGRPRFRRRGQAAAIAEGSSETVVKRDALYRRLLAMADVLAAASALVLTFLVFGDNDALRPPLLLGIPLVVLVSKVIGLYDRDEHLLGKATLDEAPALFQVATLYTLIVWLGQPVLVGGKLGRGQGLALWALLFFLLLLGRVIARQVALMVTTQERCLVLGDQRAAERLRRKLEWSRSINAEVVGRIPLDEETMVAASDPALGDMEHLGAALAEHDIHRVIIAPRTADSDHLLDVIRLVKAMGAKVSVLPRMFEVVGSSVRFDDVEGLTLLGVPRFGLTKSSHMLKRSLDLVGSGAALVALAPLLAAIAVAVKLTSRGPVFFRQTRVGRQGHQFQMLKYRTMVQGAEELRPKVGHLNEAEGLFKIENDPRLTPLGRYLRALSLDELPQLINVFRGDMSLVGPRPLVADDDRRVEGWHRRRLDVAPGMTGVWQVLGSSRIPLNEMVTIDYLYAANWSVWLDLKILLRTVPYMAARRGM
jgi:exopolysaccharide biosynthesis polyprenyl glycosylphosphotransferase